MKTRTHSTLIFLAFLTAIFLIPNRSSASREDFSTGKKIYENRCRRCHGLNAKGSPAMAKALKVDPVRLDLTRDPVLSRPAKALEKLVAGGHGRMPRQEALTPGQIRSVVLYLQSLQRAFVQKDK